MPVLKYRPAIDGLRAFAIVSVLVFHLNKSWLPGGFVGVDVFFVISGYLISGILIKEIQEHQKIDFWRFYQRRIARLFPAYFFLGFATILGTYLVYSPQDFASAGINFVASSLSVANLKFMLQGNYFEISPDAQPFLHCWSLAVEEQFYMVFPILLFVVYRFWKKYAGLTIVLLFVSSFLCCVWLTLVNPTWAFYLLLTRAWELLAGAFVAHLHSKKITQKDNRWWGILGFLFVILSFVFITEGSHFPGWVALFPVLGSTLLIINPRRYGFVEKFISLDWFVWIGKISYSLYLWHWPVFSLVDYKFILLDEWQRIVLKVGISLLCAVGCFKLIESPTRSFFNRKDRIAYGYVFVVVSLLIVVPLGIYIRKENYVNAQSVFVENGGIIINKNRGSLKLVLMGDSNASMYGKTLKEVARECDYRLSVLSVAAGDSLPSAIGNDSSLWTDSISFIEKDHPNVIVMANLWTSKLLDDRKILLDAIDELQKSCDYIVLITQPPLLPEMVSRANIRKGLKPPFFEDVHFKETRKEINKWICGLKRGKVKILDIEVLFTNPKGEIMYLDSQNRQNYHDRTHLSGYGSDLVKEKLIILLNELESSLNSKL